MYHGEIDSEAVFDPAMLSGVFGQIKNKNKADTAAEQVIRPIGLPRDRSQPLPYIALLLELGNESTHRTSKSKIKVTVPKSPASGVFRQLTEDWMDTTKDLALGKYTGSELFNKSDESN